ncbi:putative polyprotein of retroviral origin [Ixodes scapularis]
MEHTNNTGDSAPIRCQLRPVNAHKRQIMDSCIEDLLQQDVIQPSSSQWSCAPVLVAKSGGYRLAVDYRPLNAKTQVPVYPMPRTDWVLAELGRAQWFISFGLSQSFLQIPVRQEDIPKTAFICHKGTFGFKRMPFGMAGGPATFEFNKQLTSLEVHSKLVYSD